MCIRDSFGVGATGVIFAERTTPELLFELIATHRPSILVNVPTMMQAMLDHPSAATLSLIHISTRVAARRSRPVTCALIYARSMRER